MKKLFSKVYSDQDQVVYREVGASKWHFTLTFLHAEDKTILSRNEGNWVDQEWYLPINQIDMNSWPIGISCDICMETLTKLEHIPAKIKITSSL